MSNELAVVYASLILADGEAAITADKLSAITKAAGITIEPVWAKVFAQVLANASVTDIVSKVGTGAAVAAPAAGAAAGASSGAAAAAAPEPEPEKEESDEDMGFGLFD